ncbi:hypothetical protein AVMA1855_18480 [Acidovorax sp. SUPP1855]|uniref:hypothetical protein n=1 Tax=Acidovorax sp. SUPP1855 TaxID=431774 RepID=UPI0023DE5207|nr:hypothetical protein [Acidovorax sp. SUPP1855]GKS86170.1 hypothetical protein AVMA1855_18480 [Acidovorax sp. SUPP1855]
MKFALFVRPMLVVPLLCLGLAHAQDSAVFDAQKNAWKLYYQDPETSQWVNKTYIQQNAIKPGIKSAIQASGSEYIYRYRLSNSREAKQAIDLFRIWGIPLVYAIPNLPAVTANAKTENDRWTQQYWNQLISKRNFETKIIKAPTGWSGNLRVDENVGQTSFVWTPGLKDTDPDGISPGKTQDGFVVTRVELPGMARAKLTGATPEPWGLDNLPDTPYWNQKIDEIQDLDYVLVPVLAPVIPVPTPYSGAELARRLKTHVQSWVKYEHIHADVLTRLNRQFDVLIPALEMNNQPTARAAVAAMRKECTDHHRDLVDAKAGEDDDTQVSVALPRTPAQRSATPTPAFDRLAARALMFDLRYLLDRMDTVR